MYPEVQFSTKGTAAQVDKNIETLRQARIVQSKIAAAKQNIPVRKLLNATTLLSYKYCTISQ